MPDKSRRVASRQAELRRRRVGRMRTGAAPSSVLNEPMRVSGPLTATAEPARAPGGATAMAGNGARAQEGAMPYAPVYEYVGRELLRIGIFAAIIIALLIAAAFVLK